MITLEIKGLIASQNGMETALQLSKEERNIELIADIKNGTTFSKACCWKDYKHFIHALLEFGGIIEAEYQEVAGLPDEYQYPISHLLIYPDGEIVILGSSSLVYIERNEEWGGIYPQQSISQDLLDEKSIKMAEFMSGNGFVGYVSFEFMVCLENNNIWFKAIMPYIGSNLSYLYLILLANASSSVEKNGSMQVNINHGKVRNYKHIHKTAFMNINELEEEAEKLFPTKMKMETRCFLVSPGLIHQSLNYIGKTLFNKLCACRGVDYDETKKTGTFMPVLASVQQVHLSLVVSQTTLVESVETFLRDMALINRSLPDTVGPINNFGCTLLYFRSLLQHIRPLYTHQAIQITDTFVPNLMEQQMSTFCDLSTEKLASIPLAVAVKCKGEKITISLTNEVYNLLQVEPPSKDLRYEFSDFGMESLGTNAYFRKETRIKQGLTVDGYINALKSQMNSNLNLGPIPEEILNIPQLQPVNDEVSDQDVLQVRSSVSQSQNTQTPPIFSLPSNGNRRVSLQVDRKPTRSRGNSVGGSRLSSTGSFTSRKGGSTSSKSESLTKPGAASSASVGKSFSSRGLTSRSLRTSDLDILKKRNSTSNGNNHISIEMNKSNESPKKNLIINTNSPNIKSTSSNGKPPSRHTSISSSAGSSLLKSRSSATSKRVV